MGGTLARRILLSLFLLVVLGTGVVWGWAWRSEASAGEALAEALAEIQQQIHQTALEATLFRASFVPRGYAFADVLQSAGVAPAQVAPITASAQSVFDLRRVRAGNPLAIGEDITGELRAVTYRIDAEKTLWITPASDAADRFEAEVRTEPAIVSTVTVQGELRSSLWEAILDTGEGPELVMLIADIFGWDLDFNTEPRVGDTFRVAFERKEYADGSAAYVRVFAAEYVNQGRAYRAVLFHDPNGRPAFYAPDGSSLQKMFLRSPLVFGGRISSRFSRARMHPILKRVRPHLGIDYAAPTGSPVQSIGSGRVLFAGRRRGEGNTVHIRHSNGYESMYLHLSRMLVRAGQHVDQGQRIGLVGSTGLSTAPHLDFRITQNGKYRNFEALRLPPATPVAKRNWAEFAAARDEYLALLPPANPQDVQKAATRPAGERAPTTSGQ
jgi:murein DD-endopeptidase MepM/ murein hydrolase activator NlpD